MHSQTSGRKDDVSYVSTMPQRNLAPSSGCVFRPLRLTIAPVPCRRERGDPGQAPPERADAVCGDHQPRKLLIWVGLEACPLLRVADAEALLGREGEDADLALMSVAVDVVGGLADILHRVDLRKGRVDQPRSMSRLASQASR